MFFIAVPQEILNRPNVNLIFEGLDTFGTVKLNNHTVGTSTNMFVKYIFNAKPYLKVDNLNVLVFHKIPMTYDWETLVLLQDHTPRFYLQTYICSRSFYTKYPHGKIETDCKYSCKNVE